MKQLENDFQIIGGRQKSNFVHKINNINFDGLYYLLYAGN